MMIYNHEWFFFQSEKSTLFSVILFIFTFIKMQNTNLDSLLHYH